MKQGFKISASSVIALVVLYVLFLGMLFTIAQYAHGDPHIGFLVFKQSFIRNKLWLSVFYIHVFTCVLCLPAGFTQFSGFLLKVRPRLHKAIGRLYCYNILFINFPCGLVLAVNANGGLPGKIAFTLLDTLWLYFTLAGIYWIRKGNIRKHKAFMIRSYSLTLTALTLRILKLIIVHVSDWSYNQIYVFDAWTALLLNLVIAEALIFYINHRPNLKLLSIK